jgi:hypothetical protein
MPQPLLRFRFFFGPESTDRAGKHVPRDHAQPTSPERAQRAPSVTNEAMTDEVASDPHLEIG